MTSTIKHYRRNAAGELEFVGFEYREIPNERRPHNSYSAKARLEREIHIAEAVRDDFERLVDAACESAAE